MRVLSCLAVPVAPGHDEKPWRNRSGMEAEGMGCPLSDCRGFLFPVCQRGCTGSPQTAGARFSKAAARELKFLLSAAFRTSETFVNVTGEIAPAMPGSWLHEGAAVCFSNNRARGAFIFFFSFLYVLSYAETQFCLFF